MDYEQTIRINSVERDRKQRGRYILYAEDRDEPLITVHEDILIRYGLFKGQEVTASLLSQIIEEDNKQKAYTQAVAYLGRKPRTRKEIERYLLNKHTDPDNIALVIDRLISEQFIDDTDYARRFAEQRLRSHAKGRLSIKQELLQRGIAKSTAAEAVSEIDSEAELAAAIRAAEKKWPWLKGELHERNRKLAMFLYRRGYPGSVVRDAVKRVANGNLSEEDGLMLDN